MRYTTSVNYLPLLCLLAIPLAGCGGQQPSETSGTWETGVDPDPVCTALLEPGDDGEDWSDAVYLEYASVVGSDGWYIARIDRERDWWGSFTVFRWDGSVITGRAGSGPEEPLEVTGQSVDEIGSLLSPGIDDPVVYVIDRTHQGNRMLYLWRLGGDGCLHPLCKARITLSLDGYDYDLEWGIENGDDGPDRLVLEGEMTCEPDVAAGPGPAAGPIVKVYVLDDTTGMFLLDYDLSTGIESWDFMDSGFTEQESH